MYCCASGLKIAEVDSVRLRRICKIKKDAEKANREWVLTVSHNNGMRGIHSDYEAACLKLTKGCLFYVTHN